MARLSARAAKCSPRRRRWARRVPCRLWPRLLPGRAAGSSLYHAAMAAITSGALRPCGTSRPCSGTSPGQAHKVRLRLFHSRQQIAARSRESSRWFGLESDHAGLWRPELGRALKRQPPCARAPRPRALVVVSNLKFNSGGVVKWLSLVASAVQSPSTRRLCTVHLSYQPRATDHHHGPRARSRPHTQHPHNPPSPAPISDILRYRTGAT